LLTSMVLILLVDLGLLFPLAIAYVLMPATDDRARRLRLTLALSFAVTALPMFIIRSPVSNDLFMRGMIPATTCIALAAALCVERAGVFRSTYAWCALTPILLLHMTNGVNFLRQTAVQLGSGVLNQPFRYIRDSTPKDAIVFVQNATL